MSDELRPGTRVKVNEYYPFPIPLDGAGTWQKGPDGDGYHEIRIGAGNYLLKPSEFDVQPKIMLTSVTLPGADVVDHPSHYTSSPASCTNCGEGIECIQITQHMGFNLGNVIKYVWRCELKRDAIEDLRKARWYIDNEIEKREKAAA